MVEIKAIALQEYLGEAAKIGREGIIIVSFSLSAPLLSMRGIKSRFIDALR